MIPSVNRLVALLAVGLVFLPMPALAGEVDRCLPEDTEFFLTINVKQILNSPLGKTGVEDARQFLKGIEEVKTVLEDLGFDPFQDVERITLAGAGGIDKDRGMMIIRGAFNLDKFKAAGEKAAENHGDVLKLHKLADGQGGQHLIYEVLVPEIEVSLFVSLADRSTMLVSPGKDYVVDALRRLGGKAPHALKNRDFEAVIDRLDPSMGLSLAALGSALTKGDVDLGPFKEFLNQAEAIGGSVAIDRDLRIELLATMKAPETAKEIHDRLKEKLSQGLAILALLSTQNKDLSLILDILKSIRLANKDKTLILRAQIDGEIIENALKMDK